MSIWAMYALLGVIIFIFTSVSFLVYKNSQTESKTASETSYKNVAAVPVATDLEISSSTPWEVIYPTTESMKIGGVDVKASIAQNWPDRIKGLSDTPYLPEDVVKIFVFDSAGYHSIWMKDMNYSIDIIWVDADSKIVHIEKDASPESYPGMFVTEVPATYVIETVTGFAAKNEIVVGDVVELPKL